ncbi:hypothetical protein HPB48_023405 [Haemaphysalis longicornis]|uniref:Uncharacterized protein n=1 Tax=Haemaphysalis longicornis TaxID=44386 RepID=A0A9J6H597_HAELO|nr:hypothetical protein HPB48_023405 [Haemaphysalis longicornis]
MPNAAVFRQPTEVLMSAIVGNIDNESCMSSWRTGCPGKDTLRTIFGAALDIDKVEDFYAENWITGVGCILEKKV